MSIKVLKRKITTDGRYQYRLLHFPGDDKYIIEETDLTRGHLGKLYEAEFAETKLSGNKEKAMEYWNNKIEKL